MAIWGLDSDINFTRFIFPIEEDKLFFYGLVETHFEASKSLIDNWRPLYMQKGDPMKHPDFFEIEETDVIAISQNALEKLRRLFNDKIELLPIETDAGRYYALNVLNFVDCLDKKASKFLATEDGIIVNHSLLDFIEERISNNAIFKIPELPYKIFITTDFLDICEEEYLQGLLFDGNSNLIWYPE